MKLRARPEVPSDANLFEPWERLLLVSIELENVDAPVVRELAAACFAVVRHMAGRLTRDDAYRAVSRALAAAREASRSTVSDTIPAPPPAPAIQHELPVDDRMTIRVSPEAHEVITAYARERGLTFEVAAERLLRTACRRRDAVNKWNQRERIEGGPASR
jgi:hypothetical protein